MSKGDLAVDLKKMKRPMPKIARDEAGVAAVEFALFAPILFFACLATVDLGMALNERMTIDHVLRAGAQSAMADPGEAKVKQVIEDTAEASNFSVNVVSGTDQPYASASYDTLTIAVEKYHACPEAAGTKVPEGTICASGEPTYVYYRMASGKIYQAMILPDISFGPMLDVQIR